MKRVLILLILTVLYSPLKADEGMWIPMLIGKNYEQMKKQGFKLTPEDLYSINKASLKDAIVSFGGFCTGEIVSKNGLIFTNHHCGYDAIASNSTLEHNLLDSGFYAKSYAEEKPIPGLFVNFLVRMEDVTEKVNASIKGLSATERTAKLQELNKELSAQATQGTHYEAFIRDFYKGNQYFLYVFEKFTDVRLVGNPPQSIGKFGGDTDNWEWPRHTGDFSIFRVYANQNNLPAEFASTNKPYTPKKFIPISLKGIENKDFAMVYGFPGRTDRFLTSYGVNLATNFVSPEIVKLRDIRLKAWKEQMDKDVAVRLKLSSIYANIANYWKYFIGQTQQLKKLKIFDQKTKQEQEFTGWAKGNADYENLMNDYAKVYENYQPYAIHRTFINEGFLASQWVRLANQMAVTLNSMNEKSSDTAFVNNAQLNLKKSVDTYAETFNEAADKKIFAQILNAFYTDVPKYQHPKFITLIVEDYWDGSVEATFKKFANAVYEKSILVKPDKLNAFLENPSINILEKDLGYQYAKNLVPAEYIKANFGSIISDFDATKMKLDRYYLAALLSKNKGGLMYPDANSTMRISYGNVQNYSPKDGILYEIQTNLDGAVAKYVPGDSEFDLPQNLLSAYATKNYGIYGKDGMLPVCFITNNDITGGNSGSPVINGNGELLGLAFDGNWEAMSGDIAFDKNFKRTICVDIRYVLWCVDILGGAKNIINELELRKPVATKKVATSTKKASRTKKTRA